LKLNVLRRTEWGPCGTGSRAFRIRRPYNSDSPSLNREQLLNNYRKLNAKVGPAPVTSLRSFCSCRHAC